MEKLLSKHLQQLSRSWESPNFGFITYCGRWKAEKVKVWYTYYLSCQTASASAVSMRFLQGL